MNNFYDGITPIIFIYLINLKKYICKIIILKKKYNKNNNCKIIDYIIMGIIVIPFDN